MLKPKRSEIGNWKLNVAKNQGSVSKVKVTLDMLFNKYSKQKAITSDQSLKKRMRSPIHQERPSSPPRVATRFKGESYQQGRHFIPAWTPDSLRPIYDDNGVMWVPYQQSFHPRRGGSRRPALDQFSQPTRDRWTPRQPGQGHQDHPVRPPPIGGQTALPRKVQFSSKQVYKPKIIAEKVEEMNVDPERTTNQDIQIGAMDIPVEKDCKRPVVFNRLGHLLKRDLLLLVTIRPVEVVPTPSTFYRDGVLPV
jgi:hypothetical protein